MQLCICLSVCVHVCVPGIHIYTHAYNLLAPCLSPACALSALGLTHTNAHLSISIQSGKSALEIAMDIKDGEKKAAVLAVMEPYSVMYATQLGKADLVATAIANRADVNATHGVTRLPPSCLCVYACSVVNLYPAVHLRVCVCVHTHAHTCMHMHTHAYRLKYTHAHRYTNAQTSTLMHA